MTVRFPSIISTPLLTLTSVVHAIVGLDVSTAIKELKALVSGDLSSVPSSGLGSNVTRAEGERRVPRSIGCGAGIPEEGYQKLREGVGEGVIWIRLTIEDVRAAGGTGGPNPELINKMFRSKLKEAGL
jgi:hypothetical protein